MCITVQEKLNLTFNWSTSIITLQSNWWPVMSHSISDGAVGLFFTIVFIFLIFKLPSDIVGAMQGDTYFLQHYKYAWMIYCKGRCETPTFCCDVAATTGGFKKIYSHMVLVWLYSSSHHSKEWICIDYNGAIW